MIGVYEKLFDGSEKREGQKVLEILVYVDFYVVVSSHLMSCHVEMN